MVEAEIATPEYIHNVVKNFIDDFIGRRVFLRDLDQVNDLQATAKRYANFGELIRTKYFDTKIIGSERSKLEKEIFDWIIAFTTGNMILPSKFSATTDNERIEKLERKIESSNKLMTSLLHILQEVSKKLDNL